MKLPTQNILKNRKFYMILPVLVIPFFTLSFWALGGGQGVAAGKARGLPGLNSKLPEARFDQKLNAWDKLSLYQIARRDSLKVKQAKETDPYFRLPQLKTIRDTAGPGKAKNALNHSLGNNKKPMDQTEAKVYQKLAELQKQIDKPAAADNSKTRSSTPEIHKNNSSFENDVDRLESMMRMMQNAPAPGAEMNEINSVLNAILDIQHPERLNSRLKKQQGDGHTYSATTVSGNNNIGLLSGDEDSDGAQQNEFYGLGNSVAEYTEANSIQAEVYGDQNLVSGSVIKIELLQDISVNGARIPKNQFVYGVCALNGERLTININSIQNDHSIYPVEMTVYDIDGQEGIYVPGAIARDAAKKSSAQSIQDIRFAIPDASIGMQAASTGLEAAKGMLSKKTRLVQVSVKAGYKVYLRDKNLRATTKP
ncbi:MAG TPA: conjugative transposon protein TraM [Chryseosolibacter sp.]